MEALERYYRATIDEIKKRILKFPKDKIMACEDEFKIRIHMPELDLDDLDPSGGQVASALYRAQEEIQKENGGAS